MLYILCIWIVCCYFYVTVEQFLQVIFLANVVFSLKNCTGNVFNLTYDKYLVCIIKKEVLRNKLYHKLFLGFRNCLCLLDQNKINPEFLYSLKATLN